MIRFWSSFIYEHTGEFLEVQLLPALRQADSAKDQETDASDSEEKVDAVAKMPSELEGDTVGEEGEEGEEAALRVPAPGDSESQAETKRPTESIKPGAMPDGLPKRIGAYEILEEIGQGGFSKVYRAVESRSRQVVALKVLRNESFYNSAAFREQLLAREQLVADLDHANIIPVYAVTEEDGIPHIAMKLVQAGSLADRLEQHYWRPTVREVLEIAKKAAEGLAYLHENQIIHRDVKSANILLSYDNKDVYLTDFGIAQVFESAFKGMIVGTAEYLAPEAILHPDNIDGRVGQYAMGIILFQLFTGCPPFESDSIDELLYLQVNEAPPTLFATDDAYKSVAMLIDICLAKDPEKRLQSAEELVDCLELLLSSAPSEHLETKLHHFAGDPKRRFKPHDTAKIGEKSGIVALRRGAPISEPQSPPLEPTSGLSSAS